jgi:hypothetical protein
MGLDFSVEAQRLPALSRIGKDEAASSESVAKKPAG